MSAAAHEAHNRRRRENRALKSAIASWAQKQKIDPGAIAVLVAAPPTVAIAWARSAGAPKSLLALPLREGPARGIEVPAHWATPDVIDAVSVVMARQGVHPAERQLLEPSIDSFENVGDDDAGESGVNLTRRVSLSDGSQAYHKAFSGLDFDVAEDYGQGSPLQPIHEVAAWILARELGDPFDQFVPACVLRPVDGHVGSFARAVGGVPMPPKGEVSDEHLRAAGFFDALIGQQDRHIGNLLIDDGSLHLIDHGFTFAVFGDQFNMSSLQKLRRESDSSVSPAELAMLKRLVKSRDLLGMAGILEHSRGEALRDRAQRMIDTGEIPMAGEY